jgi:hypothetical protein
VPEFKGSLSAPAREGFGLFVIQSVLSARLSHGFQQGINTAFFDDPLAVGQGVAFHLNAKEAE